ncbi:uncharacterized protein LOC141673782 [Apium graveolens]|uniref:uncharacterized protein LOC141673782 n=1 Tax=Apium graveolens TaxID=4045 RepID=UPI003D79BC3B
MIWKSQNDLVWNQRSLEVRKVVDYAICVLNQRRYVQDKSFDALMGYMTHDDGYEHSQLPKEKKVEVNCDAVIFENSNSYNYAFVIRNHLGQFIEPRSKCLQGQASPELAEVVGVREALSWIKENQYSEVDVESDCQQVVQAIQSFISCLSYFGRVIEECRLLLVSLKDRNVLFRFIKRSENGLSHFITRHYSSIVDRVWRVGMSTPNFNMY